MSDKSDFDLLADIAKLIKKYGPEAFDSLAQNLANPEFAEHLVTILTTTARTARTVGGKLSSNEEGARTPRDFRSSLVELEQTEPEKSALLLKLYDDLMSRTVLPTLREMQAFASDAGLPRMKATSREKAVIPLVKLLLSLPIEELRLRLSSMRPAFTDDDRSLEGWSNIILNKERRTKGID